MQIKRLNVNSRLSGAVVFGPQVFVSGQVPDTRDADCATQTREVLAKIDALLTQANSDNSRLLSAQIWLKDIGRDFAAMNGAWSEWLPEGCAPARATIQADLASADILVEIMVTAAVND
ncbi:RidA family protein [Pseudomonas sp. PB120]|uniref:RidA family protein n=1 Tax=Pseudomonas sp. PB120 TaxID=2494700 RepID=UPI0012FE198F|nr:RidA family protein [Pseudomonas sp. PB120]MVV47542.1 RidA family protein [Pseudomonas sp. PB120]